MRPKKCKVEKDAMSFVLGGCEVFHSSHELKRDTVLEEPLVWAKLATHVGALIVSRMSR